jgi:hypothetical protein
MLRNTLNFLFFHVLARLFECCMDDIEKECCKLTRKYRGELIGNVMDILEKEGCKWNMSIFTIHSMVPYDYNSKRINIVIDKNDKIIAFHPDSSTSIICIFLSGLVKRKIL